MENFSGKLRHQAWMVDPSTVKVMEALRENGGDARFVGGCVRNALVNRKVLDIDIATPLKPEKVIDRLARHKIGYAPTGLKHGTVTALVDGHPFEITTLRHDVETFGRHAKVEFTDDWEADAARRDFTINAIFATMEGDLSDPFGGVEDLRLGRVRFVGEPAKRIEEDVLRILRFFRFYAHFGRGEPDEAALKACAAAADKIPALSAERIRQEILKLLEADSCPAVWKLMIDCGVMAYVLPEAANVRALENLVALEAEYPGDAFPLRRLAALLNAEGAAVRRVAEKLRLSNGQTAQLARMLEPDAKISTRMETAEARRLVYRIGNDMARNLLLLAAAKSGDRGDMIPLYQEVTSFRPPRFPVLGTDVLKQGLAPGPEVGRVLGELEDWWIGQNFVPGRTECLKMLAEKAKP